MKVFWTEVGIATREDGYGLALDGRAVRTPSKAELVLPTAELAEAVADEWRAQTVAVLPDAMPLTRAANTAIDRVARAHPDVAGEVARYGETDLICYRAPHPVGLAARQAVHWDPLVEWSRKALDAPLTLAEGVMYCSQPEASLAALSNAVLAHDAWELTALHDLVALSGSLVIGLAVSRGRLGATDAWTISRVDEQWNVEEWGEDDEAADLVARKRRDFENADRLLELVRSR